MAKLRRREFLALDEASGRGLPAAKRVRRTASAATRRLRHGASGFLRPQKVRGSNHPPMRPQPFEVTEERREKRKARPAPAPVPSRPRRKRSRSGRR